MSQPITHSVPLAVHFAPKSLTQLGINANVLEVSLSYEVTALPKTGLALMLGKLPLVSDKPVMMDIDIGCGLYDHNGKLIETVWYGNTRDGLDSVRHEGDDFHGLSQTNTSLAELLSIRLLQLSEDVARVLIFIHSHKKQPLIKARLGKATLQDNEGNDIHHIDFASLHEDCIGLCAWQIIRTSDDWRIEAATQNSTEQTANLRANKASTIHELITSWQVV